MSESWHALSSVGGHTVYNKPAQRTKVLLKTRLQFGTRFWENATTLAKVGDEVEVSVPVGALSGLNKSVIVRLASGRVEVWRREDDKAKSEEAA